MIRHGQTQAWWIDKHRRAGVLCQDRDQGYDALEMFARMVQRLDETDK
jgi:hypothetical protein